MNRLYRVTYLRNGVDKHTIIIPSTSFGDEKRSTMNTKHWIAKQIHGVIQRTLGGTIEIISYKRVEL